MNPESALVLLLSVATAVALATRRLKLPYTVGLVLAGLALGSTGLFSGIRLTKGLLYALFLPGLLFEAAYHLKFDELRANARAIVMLAVPGVLVATFATAALIVASSRATGSAAGLGWSHALVFAALISATDPIAVTALFRSLGAPKRLEVLIEGESLVNDGTATVLFTIVLGAASGHAGGFAARVLEFIISVGMGAAIGAAVAGAVAFVIQKIDEPRVEITLTAIAAYGSFAAAEHFHFSGIIASATAGMFCGSFTAPRGMTETTRVLVESFWEYVAFALNSIVFLLIGLQVRLGSLLAAWRPILFAFVAMTVARALVVGVVGATLWRSRERIPWRWSVVLTWGGLRGALSIVLALALPDDYAHRDVLVVMTIGVVFLSIVVQGLTAAPLLRGLRVASRRE